MKKAWWKRLVCGGLGLMTALSLAACGEEKPDPNAALAKENVYKFQELKLPAELGENYDFYGTVCRDGKIYLLVEVYHWDEADYTGNETDIRLITMNEDGSDSQIVALDIPKTENSAGNATIQKETQTVRMARSAVIGTSVPDIAVEANPNNVWEYTNYRDFIIGADGAVYGIKMYNYSRYDEENPDNNVDIRTSYLCTWNMDGSLKREVELEGLVSDEVYYYIAGFSVDENGDAYFLVNGDNACMMTVDAQGTASGIKPLKEETSKVLGYLDRMIDKGDGTFYVLYRDENDWTKSYYTTYDFKTDTLGEPVELPSNLRWSGYSTMVAGKYADLLYSTEEGLFALNRGDTAGTRKMSFINSDLNIYGFDSLTELDENRFVGTFTEAYDGKTRAGIFTYVEPEDIQDKLVLVLAGEYVNSDLKQRVVEFNRSNEKYRIVVKEYQSLNGPDNYMAGVTQLNLDITTNGMPDILLTPGLYADNYAAKGLLADINEFLKNDEELSETEFMQNVFDSYSMDGKLHYVIPSFSVNTMAAKTAVVGDRKTWTMKEMKDLMATLPEGTNLLSDLNRDGFFNMAMQYCGSDFVDASTGKCNFNSEGFIELMKFAINLPEEFSDDYYEEMYGKGNYETQYRDNRTILCPIYIGAIKHMNYTVNGSFGEPITYIGFPTDSGEGSYLEAREAYAISEKSRYKDVAWEFLRYYLTDEYQDTITYGLPVQKERFMELAQEAMQKPYWIDQEGNKVEYDESFWMNGEEITLPPMSKEQVDAVIALISSVTKHPYINEEVLNLINEDMGAYFSGDKSAEDVAGLIQNRVQLYIDVNG